MTVRVLLTGATGLVGNNCLRQLVGKSETLELHALVRMGHDERPFAELPVKRHLADLTKPDEISSSLSTSLPRFDVIIHSAGDTHIGKRPRPMQRIINVDATAQLARLAREQGARMIFISSVDALPAGSIEKWTDEETVGGAKFACGYVETKRDAEAAIQAEIERGLEGYIINPGFMLGAWDWKPSSGRMLLEVAKNFTPFGPKGGFSVCDVAEVAKAICKVALDGAPQQRYILAGNNVRYIDAWRVFADVSGGSKPICPAGPLMRIIAGRWGDLMAGIRGVEGDVNSAAIGMSDLYHYYDSGRAERELDYRIPPVADIAKAAWDWFREYGYA